MKQRKPDGSAFEQALEERIAIMIYDGNVPEKEAVRLAYQDVFQSMQGEKPKKQFTIIPEGSF